MMFRYCSATEKSEAILSSLAQQIYTSSAEFAEMNSKGNVNLFIYQNLCVAENTLKCVYSQYALDSCHFPAEYE